MPFTFDEATYKISMPPGDTGDLYITIDWDAQGKDAVAVFAIVDKATCTDVLLKYTDIVNNEAHFRFCNQDTRTLKAGTYCWQLRIVTSPTRDEAGKVIVDENTDDVISVFCGDELPTFRIEKGGATI